MRPLQIPYLHVISTIILVFFFTVICRGSEDINAIDENGNRQGYWKITGAMTAEAGYRDNQLVEEGSYQHGKKTGLWKKYYPTGSLKNEITFENNLPRGPYKVYYPNGKLEEIGNWQGNKNIGSFKRYHPSGKPAQIFNFTDAGKRDGVQNYFYENGNLQLTVEVADGIADGIYETYYPDGKLNSEKFIREGVLDESSVKEYKPAKEEYADTNMPEVPEKIESQKEKEEKSISKFEHSGENKLYNHRKQVTQSGEFKEGRLWNGKWHKYDPNGNLKKVEVYQDGKFAGYAKLEDSNN